MKTILKAGTTDTTINSKKKKRLFYPNKYYVFDEANTCIAVVTNPKELKDVAFEDTDTILIGVHPNKMFPERNKIVTKIVLDFEKEEITIEGDNCTIAKVEYEGGHTYTLEAEDLKDWEEMIKDSKKIAKEFEMIGTPPIEGDKLDVE